MGEGGSGLVGWLAAPSHHRGIRFAQDDGGWRFTSYAELASDSRRVAGRLADEDLAAGSVIAIVVPSGPDFVAAYFGALLSGHTPCPLVPPALFESRNSYVEHTAGLLRAAGGPVLCDAQLLDVVRKAMSGAGLEARLLRLDSLGAREQEMTSAPLADVSLLQFTSGSSGHPRGVRVSRENLEAMIQATFAWVPWGAGDAGAHWLPLYHDFGLIGCLLSPASRQRDLWVLRPEQFVVSPERWLECFGRRRAAFAAAPPFAFSYALRKVAPEALRGTDFSGWRTTIIGAERVDAGVLGRFARMLAPRGLRLQTFTPAYGLAEATLAVTGVDADDVARVVQPDWTSLRIGRPVRIRRRAPLGSDEIGDGAGWLVSCGRPRAGNRAEVVDRDGTVLPPDHLGEVRVTGPTVARGYVGAPSRGLTRFTAEGLLTADAGFLHDGELYVVGRIGDSIKVRGRSVFAEDLEAKLAGVDGVRRGRCCVVPAAAEAGTAVVAIIESGDGGFAADRILALLRGEAGAETPIRVVAVPPGSIPRTSSGKPRRRLLSERLLEGSLEMPVVAAVGD